MVALHKNVTTTSAIRAAIQSSSGSGYALSRQTNLSRDTTRKWRRREMVLDGSRNAHRRQTTLNAGQEELGVHLRTALRLPLDDLLAVICEFIEPSMSRSALDLRLRGFNRLPGTEPSTTPTQPLKAYGPGYVHVDVQYLPQKADEDARRYRFAAIDRVTRWVFVVIKSHRTAPAARSFLNALAKAAPFKIRTLLADSGTEFTDRLFGGRARMPSGELEFDRLCQALGIEHRLSKPEHPQTNGMVERFNGRIAQLLWTHRLNSAEDLHTTRHRYVWLYNQHLPQKALEHVTPAQTLKRWRSSHPHLFSKAVRIVRDPTRQPRRYVAPQTC